jgi:hypothetical protein
MGGMRNEYNVSAGKRSLGRTKRRWQNYISGFKN